MKHIPYGRQDIRPEDIEAVATVLRSDWLTQGPAIERFEQALAQVCAAPQAIAVANATAALHLACLALDLGPGDRLWTVPNTFVASANCGRYCGADVDFVDIDPATLNLSVAALEEKLREAARTQRLPKVLVAVHFGGLSCDMREIRRLAAAHGVRVIEDASHAVGASYGGKPVGCGEHSDITVFSFHPVKIITTGEGGMLTTRDAALAQRLRELRTHGITRDAARMSGASEGAWYYEQHELGYNYRITDIQCALGHAQLTRLDEYIARRRALADRYDRLLARLPVQRPGRAAYSESAWHLYPVQMAAPHRRAVFDRMRAAGIGVNVHYIPVHLQPYYRGLGFAPGQFPNAERYYAGAISLPMHGTLTDDEQDFVVATLESALA